MQFTGLEITVETAIRLGLNAQEFEQIKNALGRLPNFTELNMYAALWSERCSCKHSIQLLKNLPQEGKRLLKRAPGDTAGLLDIGDGLACAVDVGSYNHPSSAGQFQGAVASVASTHSSVFARGARPIAALNSLHLGSPAPEPTRHFLDGMVKAISDYGNSLGVATVVGEGFLSECPNQNILVNTMSVGTVRPGKTVQASAEGPGNPVFIVGHPTGKEGVHGAFISPEGLDAENPDWPVGPPPKDKMLLEASLEAAQIGAVVGMKGVGIAGIACSTLQMMARAGTGMVLNLDQVPTRDDNMEAWEILLSESQGRLLVVGKAGEEQALKELFERWGLACAPIGEVTGTGLLECFFRGEKVAELPAGSLEPGGGELVYERETAKPAYLAKTGKFNPKQINTPRDLKAAARQLFASPNLASKRWIYEQHDSQAANLQPASHVLSDAAVVPLDGSDKSLVLTMDCNARYAFADPFIGAMITVSEASRNIVCSGGTPMALTHCLHFGNPEQPGVNYQFAQTVKGIGEACRKFGTPVAGGNVSFYNQPQASDKTEPECFTPVIGMLGILEDPAHQTTFDFKSEGDVIYMLGNTYNDVGGSEYVRALHGVQYSPPPSFDLYEEFEVQKHTRKLIREDMVNSAHDVSRGGLFTCLMESAVAGGLGFNIETVETFRKDCFLFGESQSRIVITLSPDKEDELQNYLINNNVSFTKLGEVFGNSVVIDEENFGSVNEWKRIYDKTLAEKMER